MPRFNPEAEQIFDMAARKHAAAQAKVTGGNAETKGSRFRRNGQVAVAAQVPIVSFQEARITPGLSFNDYINSVQPAVAAAAAYKKSKIGPFYSKKRLEHWLELKNTIDGSTDNIVYKASTIAYGENSDGLYEDYHRRKMSKSRAVIEAADPIAHKFHQRLGIGVAVVAIAGVGLYGARDTSFVRNELKSISGSQSASKPVTNTSGVTLGSSTPNVYGPVTCAGTKTIKLTSTDMKAVHPALAAMETQLTGKDAPKNGFNYVTSLNSTQQTEFVNDISHDLNGGQAVETPEGLHIKVATGCHL